ncbi:MAG: hypothetical protein WC289_02155 [Patescibacteria group bacterium]|jgi:hypothetical protein
MYLFLFLIGFIAGVTALTGNCFFLFPEIAYKAVQLGGGVCMLFAGVMLGFIINDRAYANMLKHNEGISPKR